MISIVRYSANKYELTELEVECDEDELFLVLFVWFDDELNVEFISNVDSAGSVTDVGIRIMGFVVVIVDCCIDEWICWLDAISMLLCNDIVFCDWKQHPLNKPTDGVFDLDLDLDFDFDVNFLFDVDNDRGVLLYLPRWYLGLILVEW